MGLGLVLEIRVYGALKPSVRMQLPEFGVLGSQIYKYMSTYTDREERERQRARDYVYIYLSTCKCT